MNKPRTSLEFNIHHIKRLSKLIAVGKITLKEAGLNERFSRLKLDNLGMYEEMYPKYIEMVKTLNKP
jgi:hypothetical protein